MLAVFPYISTMSVRHLAFSKFQKRTVKLPLRST